VVKLSEHDLNRLAVLTSVVTQKSRSQLPNREREAARAAREPAVMQNINVFEVRHRVVPIYEQRSFGHEIPTIFPAAPHQDWHNRFLRTYRQLQHQIKRYVQRCPAVLRTTAPGGMMTVTGMVLVVERIVTT
jgi:hypothetical protein